MPCYYTGSAEGDAKLAYSMDMQKMGQKLTELTQLLCEACKAIENSTSSFNNASKELKKWWKEHKKIDKKNTSLKKQKGLSKIQIDFINENKEAIKKQLEL